MKSLWTEIRNNFIEDGDYITRELIGDIDCIVYIDAWKTLDDAEEGTVIAKVIKTKHNDIIVNYIDTNAKFDAYAQEIINEAIEDLKK